MLGDNGPQDWFCVTGDIGGGGGTVGADDGVLLGMVGGSREGAVE